MKYSKNSFITVPNKQELLGLDAKAQVLFMWLCVHSDDDESCFPSRTTLSKECGISKRSIDSAIKILEDKKLILKKNRMRGNEKTTNLYTVLIKLPSANSAPPSAKNVPTRSANSAHRTQYNFNSNNLNKPIRYKTGKELNMPDLSVV